MNQSDLINPVNHVKKRDIAFRWAFLALLVYGILLAVTIIGSGFKLATHDHAQSLFSFAANPVLGLVIGMMSTALIQSSSTVTSIIVAMVAGGLPVSIAIPMIMGANIGTSITNTIVSLGHIADKREFQRAFSAATVHDFFNIICVLIFLPLEITFHILERLSGIMISWFSGEQLLETSGMNPIKDITRPISDTIKSLLHSIPDEYAGSIMALIGLGLIILSIGFMGKTMKSLMIGKAKDILHKAIGKNPVTGIASGTVMTILVQSSSTTTSLVVPLVGNGILQTKDVYPFTLGANIGTCITALLAAMAVSGDNALFALQIALVHLMYNVLGVVIVFGIKFLRNLPLLLAHGLSLRVAEHKLLGLVYISSVFFIIPFSAILIWR